MPSPERFLHEKYGELQQSEEIKSAVKRKKAVGEKVPNIPEAKIKAYLDRFDEILNTEKEGKREYGVNLVKNAILDLAVPLRKKSAEDLPENFFDLDKRIARLKPRSFGLCLRRRGKAIRPRAQRRRY